MTMRQPGSVPISASCWRQKSLAEFSNPLLFHLELAMPETSIKKIYASLARLERACIAREVTKLKRGKDMGEGFLRRISPCKFNITLKELVLHLKILQRLPLRPLPLGMKDLQSRQLLGMCLRNLKLRPHPTSKSECASIIVPNLSDLC